MKKMARLFAALVIFAASVVPAFSASAKVTYVKGKVEVNRNNEWIQLKVGDEVSETEMLSTGFQSEARINYNGSVMALAALTRITLSQLRTSGKKDFVDVYVDTGAVRSKVTHVDRDPPDYKTRTAVAVASVRGTDYVTFACSLIKVFEGAVAVEKNTEGKKTYAPQKEDEESEEEAEEASEEEQENAEGQDNSNNENSGNEEGSSDDSGSDSEGTDSGNSEKSDGGNSESGNDKGPASATTPANEISQDSSSSSIVVGANQTTDFGADGSFSNPFENSKKSATLSSDGVKTGADNDTTQTDNSVPVKKTSLKVNVTLEN